MHIVNGPFAWPRVEDATGTSEGEDGADAEVAAQASDVLMDTTTSAAASARRQAIGDYLGPGAVAVPLLDHCSTSASVHMAYVSHPTLPLVRVGLQVRCPAARAFCTSTPQPGPALSVACCLFSPES